MKREKVKGEPGLTPVLELSGIAKSFGSVHALRGADFALAAGEIHALLGENGAGKSTLLQIADGMIPRDQGSIRVRGQSVALRSPREARALGIGMVHQHFSSIGALTVRENIELAVGRMGGWADGQLLEGLDPGARVETLSVALRQRLEIAKAMAIGAGILLLDEPSAVLTPQEVDALLGLVRAFAREGGAVALVTHKLHEVFAAGDRVTVLRHGTVRLHARVSEVSEVQLAEAMLGKTGGREDGRTGGSQAPPPIFPSSRLPVVGIGDLVIHSGELVGIAAVEGNGQRELLRGIAGLGPRGTGIVLEQDRVAFVPEDRTTEGLIPSMTVTENLMLGQDADPRWSRGALLDWGAARSHAARLIASHGILAHSLVVPVRTLSGGNQQKLILARALDSSPSVLVAENATRGLDFHATAEVHTRLRAAAAAGVAVIVYSSDLDEVLELGERVLVVHAGRVREAPPGADRRLVGELMLGLQT